MNSLASGGATRAAPTFECTHCRARIAAAAPGTRHRNHCPKCLHSLHVDDARAGDRAAACRAVMEPIAIAARHDGEWSLVHRCRRCGEVRVNRTAADDDPFALLALAARPLARPPFPIEHAERIARGGGLP